MDYAFLIHSRDYTDVQRKFKIAKFLPKELIEFWCLHWPPILVKKIYGFKSKKTDKNVTGYIIGITMTAKQMIDNRKLAQKRVIQAIKKAEKLGASIVGLGALTSSVTKGGELIKDKINVSLTNGNALTVFTTMQHVKILIENNRNINTIAIIGGTGSIGQAVSKLLIKNYSDKRFLIYARTKENLNKLLKELKNMEPGVDVKGYVNNLDTVSQAEFIVVATSATEAILHSRHFKRHAIVYDMTQPQNIDKKTIKKRLDVIIFDGGLIKVPDLCSRLPFGLPDRVIFSCLGETILLAIFERRDNFSVGLVDLEKVFIIGKLAKESCFKPAPLSFNII